MKEKEGVSALTLTGRANAADLFYIASELKALKELDLASLQIEAYRGAPLQGKVYYKENTLPPGLFYASGLEKIALPPYCSVGELCFGASELREISLAQGTLIADCAFYNCHILESVHGSVYLKSIPYCAFEECTALHTFAFGKDLESISDRAFYTSGINKADLEGCTALSTIGQWAFAGCSALEKAYFPPQLRHIGQGIFAHCGALKEISGLDGLEELPALAFKDAASMETTLPENITGVGHFALRGTNGGGTLALPGTLAYLGDGAMENMAGLTALDASNLEHIPALGKDVWKGVDQKKISLKTHPSMATAFASADQWCEFDIELPQSAAHGVEYALEAIKVSKNGNLLEFESTGDPIKQIKIFNFAGMLLLDSKVGGNRAEITLDDLPGLFIVHCTLENEKTYTVKIKDKIKDNGKK